MDIASMFGPQVPPTPEQRAAMERYQLAALAMFEVERAQLVTWAGIYCRCSRSSGWLTPEGFAPPQAECIVHGQVAMMPDGRVLP